MIALENRTQKSNAQLIRQENLEEIFELAEISGDSDIAQLKALKKINDEKEFQQKLQEFLLEKDINMLNCQNQHFKINLPHSRAYLQNPDLAKYAEVHRPEWSYREYVKDQVDRAKTDLVKEDLREKLK